MLRSIVHKVMARSSPGTSLVKVIAGDSAGFQPFPATSCCGVVGTVLGNSVARTKSTHVLTVAENRRIKYRLVPGTRSPTIVFVPGYHSYAHMNGMTAKSILMYCDVNDYPCIVYDSEGTGESASIEGVDRSKVLFSHWVEDAITVVDQLAEGPVVLASCSMGGWLSLAAARKIPERIHGLVLYAPALNYAYPYFERQIAALPASIREKLDKGESHIFSHSYGEALLKKDFAEDSLQHEVDTSKPLELGCPVRILHGLQDKEVDPKQSFRLSTALTSKDVDLIYRKTAVHQLDTPPDIELFLNTLDRLLKDSPVKN